MRHVIAAACILFASMSFGCADMFRDAMCRMIEDPTGEMYLGAALAHEDTGGVVWVVVPRSRSGEASGEPWEAFLVFAKNPPVVWELKWELPLVEGMRRSGLPSLPVGPQTLLSNAEIAGTRPDILALAQLPTADRERIAQEIGAHADEWTIDPDRMLAWRRGMQVPYRDPAQALGLQPATR